jgi:HD-like signal output (HDOD) protein
MRRRILFVDDEPNVIQSIRRMLHSTRNEWDMQFANSGREALDVLAQEPFDVVVTDMRMPKMDGAQLLTEIKDRFPNIVRIVLSGHSDQEKIMQSVRQAHQYLSKPAEAEALKSTIIRACAMRDLLSQESLKGVVSKIDALPSLPSLYAEIVDELMSPNVSLEKVGQIISKDLGMTTKILQLVNSAFFALPRHISDPSQAVSLLGLDTIRALVMTVEVFSKFDQKKLMAFDIEGLWNHSIATGQLVKCIGKIEAADKQLRDDAYMAGLLHDIGKLVLADNYPDQYREIQDLMKHGCLTSADAETQILGASHAEVGAYLLGLWGLPDPIVEAVAFHHRPQDCPAKDFIPLVAVHVANAFQHGETSPRKDAGNEPVKMDADFLSKLDLNERIEIWRDKCN